MIMDLQKLVRDNIYRLTPYSCARNEFSGEARAWLDANESPFNSPYNRYPDPLQTDVKREISRLKGVSAERIFLGVGSDECIDMVYRVFCRPGVDNVVTIEPSYGMYQVCADINDVECRKALLNADFSLSVDAIFDCVDEHTKAIWICSPNNPTGNAFPMETIEAVCRRFDGIVVVDEAYIDFSRKGTAVTLLDRYPGLIVMQTLSKAWGSASVRLGMAFASKEIIDIFNRVKYPYNINLLTQQYALKMLSRAEDVRRWVDTLLAQREWLAATLEKMVCVERIYPSDANFLLVRVTDADAVYNYLTARGIVVRNRNRVALCGNCLRLTVGTEEENRCLTSALESYGK